MKNSLRYMMLAGAFIVSTFARAANIDSTEGTGYALILQKNSNLPITTFNIAFRVGSADDPKQFEGLAHLTASLMREGGVKQWQSMPARTRAQLEEFLFPLSADIGVSVGKEQISFRVTSSAADASTVFSILAQMILAPAFDNAEFERVRGEIVDVIEKQLPREDQEELGKAALDLHLYGKSHPYAHPVFGTLKGVRSASLAKLAEFYKSHFTQKRLVVGIAGVVSPELEREAKSVFKALPLGTTTSATIPSPVLNPKDKRLMIVKGPFDATGVHLGEVLPFNRANRDFDGMYLVSMGFGKHRSFVGRLMHVVREVRGLNYGAYAYVEDFPEGGHRLLPPTQESRSVQAFTLWARPTTLDNGCFLARQVYRELTSLVSSGLTVDEFKLAQSHLVGNAPLLATGIERQLGYAIDSKFYGIKGDFLKRLQTSAKVATREQTNKLVTKYLHPSAMRMVVVTPDPEKFIKEILSESCKITYAPGIEKAKDVLDEDAKISKYGLGLSADQIVTVDSATLFND